MHPLHWRVCVCVGGVFLCVPEPCVLTPVVANFTLVYLLRFWAADPQTGSVLGSLSHVHILRVQHRSCVQQVLSKNGRYD